MTRRTKFECLVFVTFSLFYFVLSGICAFATVETLPQGKPLQILQQQIDELNLKLYLLLVKSYPEGEFVTGIDCEGNVVCRGHGPAADIVAYGLGLKSHLVRSYIEITPANFTQTTYIMGCQKSDDPVGLVATDPFDSTHANHRLEVGPQFIGANLEVIAVEIFTSGNSNAYVKLKDFATGDVLATSNEVATSSPGWIECVFTPNFIIQESPIVVNFMTTTNARI